MRVWIIRMHLTEFYTRWWSELVHRYHFSFWHISWFISWFSLWSNLGSSRVRVENFPVILLLLLGVCGDSSSYLSGQRHHNRLTVISPRKNKAKLSFLKTFHSSSSLISSSAECMRKKLYKIPIVFNFLRVIFREEMASCLSWLY